MADASGKDGTEAGELPLKGLRVLDLGRMIAAPWCTQQLGDLGATIIKVERPVIGDDMRTYGPPFLINAEGGKDDSPYHIAVNRNKQSITADLSNPKGAELIRELAKQCDILVENYKVGDLARYGLDFASIHAINPGLIYCSITGYGQTGPSSHRPGLDSLFQATSGLMSLTGDADGPPQKVGVAMSDFIAGMYASVGILAALRHREVNGGLGQHIDIALLDTTIASLTNRVQTYLISDEVPQRSGAQTPGNHPAGLYACADGDLILSAGADTQFRRFAEMVGRADWSEDPRFDTREHRVLNRVELDRQILEALAKRKRAEWTEIFIKAGVMSAPINTLDEALADPQVVHRQVVTHSRHPRAGDVKVIASPIRMSGTPIGVPRIAPDLGEHTDRVLGELLGKSPEEIERLRQAGAI
ncbi:MAG: CaiB/BaiF CoA-transferase family protein [Pseudomonadota bacterium]